MLRIVGGRLSGRRFAGPKDTDARPTSDRVREALGSILDARGAIDGATVLDLYAGTGAFAFEMLSRGAASAVLVESHRAAARAIRKNAEALGLEVDIVELELGRDPPRRVVELGPFSLVFADPPYRDAADAAAVLVALARAGAFAPDAFAVLEHAARDTPFDEAALASVGLALFGRYRYGDTAVTVFRYDGADSE